MERFLQRFFREANAVMLRDDEKMSVRDTISQFQKTYMPTGEYAVVTANTFPLAR